MKAAIALLVDQETQNAVRSLVWEMHSSHGLNFRASRLPPHISLKQPFEVADLRPLESYFDQVAAGIAPFEVQLEQMQLIPVDMHGMQTAILWMDVGRSHILLQQHERLNRELAQRFGNTAAAHDGASYHFHLTLMLGDQPIGSYRDAFELYKDRLAHTRCSVKELALFIYDADVFSPEAGERAAADYMLLKTVPLGGAAS